MSFHTEIQIFTSLALYPATLLLCEPGYDLGALMKFLRQHPDIKTPHGEVHFFDREPNFQKGIEYYRGLMSESYAYQITIEKVCVVLLPRIYEV